MGTSASGLGGNHRDFPDDGIWACGGSYKQVELEVGAAYREGGARDRATCDSESVGSYLGGRRTNEKMN